MNAVQFHGKTFEDILKAVLFPGSADAARPATSGVDIEAKFDKHLALPTSIKSAKAAKTIGRTGISLSDARGFWSINHEIRMLVGLYRQEGNSKIFFVVHEFLLLPEMLDALRGDITFAEIAALHNGLLLHHFPVGQHKTGRKWAQSEKKELAEKLSQITLNPKIDSGSQRRLQCSVKLQSLIDVCSPAGRHVFH